MRPLLMHVFYAHTHSQVARVGSASESSFGDIGNGKGRPRRTLAHSGLPPRIGSSFLFGITLRIVRL